MIKILESSITGNVIATLSFLVCFASLIVTFRTMTSAEKIQKEMEKMKINAIDRQRFLEYKIGTVKKITMYVETVKKAKTISNSSYITLSNLLTEAEGFENIFKDEDYNKIKEIHNTLKNINLLRGYCSYTDQDANDFSELAIQFKSILQKGDYAL